MIIVEILLNTKTFPAYPINPLKHEQPEDDNLQKLPLVIRKGAIVRHHVSEEKKSLKIRCFWS